MAYAAFRSIGAYVPPKIMTNADFEKIIDTSDEWITKRTGIKERRILKGEGKGFSGAFLEYPEQFDIDFRFGKNLFDIGQSVLTQFSVNYHGQGTPVYYDVDGEKFPGSVNIDMSFTEVAALTKKQIVEKNR